MNNVKSKVKIIKLTAETEAEKSKRSFRIRKFVDPSTGLVFNAHKSYAENKNAYCCALRDLCSGKFKNMFEAHKAYA